MLSCAGMTTHCNVYLGSIADDNEITRLQTDYFCMIPFTIFLQKGQKIFIDYKYVKSGYYPYYRVFGVKK